MATRRKATPMYTIVQHSGYGYGQKPAFEHGLETRSVTTLTEQKAVQRAGGILLSNREAEEFADKEMYPESVDGLVPQAPGTFSDKCVDGLCIYIPLKEN